MHPNVKLATQDVQQGKAANDDAQDEKELSLSFAHLQVIKLEPDGTDANHSPDACTSPRTNRVWLKDRGEHITLVGTKSQNQDEFLPRSNLAFNCKAEE